MKALRYRAANGFGATCGVELLDLAPGVVGLALCEPPDHHGPSITNNVEIAATLAVRRLRLNPARTVCLEHYPAGNCGREAATWDYVRFGRVEHDAAGVVLADPDWRPLRTPEQWRALAEAVGRPGAKWATAGFGDLAFPDELRARIDGLWPADVPAGYGGGDLCEPTIDRTPRGHDDPARRPLPSRPRTLRGGTAAARPQGTACPSPPAPRRRWTPPLTAFTPATSP